MRPGDELEAARRGDHRVVTPAVVIAEVISGNADDDRVWHVLRRVPVVDVGAAISARAGELRSVAACARPPVLRAPGRILAHDGPRGFSLR